MIFSDREQCRTLILVWIIKEYQRMLEDPSCFISPLVVHTHAEHVNNPRQVLNNIARDLNTRTMVL